MEDTLFSSYSIALKLELHTCIEESGIVLPGNLRWYFVVSGQEINIRKQPPSLQVFPAKGLTQSENWVLRFGVLGMFIGRQNLSGDIATPETGSSWKRQLAWVYTCSLKGVLPPRCVNFPSVGRVTLQPGKPGA